MKALQKNLRKLPITIAHDIAQRAAPKMTDLTRGDFDAGTTVYGQPRPRGVDGAPLDLERTGATRRALMFTATGMIVRAVLGTKYARYLIGKYDILPNGALPVKWRAELQKLVSETKAPQ
jgi:hypothetical protein